MQFNQSHINVNNIWRELLIVSDEQPISAFQNGVITQKQGDYKTTYYTDGLYQSQKQGDIYYNWYLINSKTIEETQTEILKKDIAELKNNNTSLAQIILDMQYENAIEKIGG